MLNKKISTLLPVADEKTLAYLSLRKEFKDYACAKTDEFVALYRSSIFNLDDLVIKSDEIAYRLLSESIDKCLSSIVNLGIYDVSKERFQRTYFAPYDTWATDFQFIRDRYDELTLNAFELERRRTGDDKSSGVAVIGGGFGVEGAVQGIAIATAANLAISAVSGIGNSIGSAIENANTKRDKYDFFRNPELIQIIAANFKKLIFLTHFAVVDLANSRIEGSTVYALPSSDDIERSNAIMGNIVSGRISKEKIVELVQQAINLNPYNFDIYKYWLSEYGDEENDMIAVADIYGIEGLYEYKNELFEDFFSKLDLSTPQFCEQSKNHIKEYGNFLGLADIDDSILKINEQIETLTEQIKRVEIATKVIAEKGLDIAIPSLGMAKSTEEVVDVAIENAVLERMKKDGLGWISFFGLAGVASLMFNLPLAILLIVVAIVKYRNKKRACRTAILAEGKVQLEINNYEQGTPHSTYPNVVWNGSGMLDPADGYEWVDVNTECEFSVKPVTSQNTMPQV